MSSTRLAQKRGFSKTACEFAVAVSKECGEMKHSFGVLLFFKLKTIEDNERVDVFGTTCRCEFAPCKCRQRKLYCVVPCRQHVGLHDKLLIELRDP